MGNNGLDVKKPFGSLIIAKVIVLCVFFVVCILMLSEAFVFGSYVLPLILTYIANNVGVQAGADWVIGGILWGFPSLFLTMLFVFIHFYAFKFIFLKMWSWVFSVMNKKKAS